MLRITTAFFLLSAAACHVCPIVYAQTGDNEGTEKLGKILSPLAEDELFFSAPDQKKLVPTASPDANRSNRQEIRLLGIGRVGNLDAAHSQAIFKVNGEQLYKRTGESFDDVEVIDIGLRSVTLQRGRERWTVELFDQPVKNSIESKPTAPTVQKNSGQRNRKPSTTSARTPSSPNLGVAEPTLPLPANQVSPGVLPDPQLSIPQLPEISLPPPPPDLPDFSSER